MIFRLRRKVQEMQAVPACREASEPLFEERSDAAKVSETPYPTNGSGKNPGRGCKYYISCPVYANMPLSPRRLGTSLRIRGKLTLRKKAIKFYKCINCQVSTQRTEQEMQAVSVCFT